MKKTVCNLAMALTAASLFLVNPLYASDTDDRIESSAKESYVFRTYLKGDDIKIKSDKGAVTLTGSVSEESRKSLAKETVADITGVKSVENKLEVKGEAPEEYSDAWLITKVKSTLLFHRNVNAIGTEVLAKEGKITLRGEADSMAQKDLTTEYAGDVEGVKNVTNEMTVAPAVIDDASITALVKTTLLNHRSTRALKTTVGTEEGLVTLGGNAGNAAEKALVTKLVSDVHGVKKVDNRMTVN
ncbi:MAG: BON domain-containing protein [Desulfamplus sp.]|nr:BON domain-containing protein [Desulfamplus sp.]